MNNSGAESLINMRKQNYSNFIGRYLTQNSPCVQKKIPHSKNNVLKKGTKLIYEY